MQSLVTSKGIVKRRRIIFFLPFIFLFAFANSALAQTISLSLKEASIEKAFRRIEAQTAYRFIYSQDAIKKARLVTVNLTKASLKDVLTSVFLDQPLKYSVEDSYIMVKEKEEGSNDSHYLTGTVTDEDGHPLQGVNVLIKGTNRGGSTNENGEFTLANVNETDVVVFSFVGRESQEIIVGKTSTITVSLHTVSKLLDETIVQAYGVTTRRLNTGNISKITGEDISKQPVANPLLAMQGRAPGVFVTAQNGLPGGNVKILIRGQGSIAAGTDPLYVIDGVPFLSSSINTPNPANGAVGGVSPLSILNPGDIESIEVLKDADATSLYGSRGANGVILITTKKAHSGKTGLTLNVYKGISKLPRFNDFLDLKQYLQIRREAFANDHLTPDPNNAPDLLVWDTANSTDWQKRYLGRNANVTDVQAGLSGGSANTHFLFRLNYRSEGTIFPTDARYRKGGGYFNFDHTTQDKKFYSNIVFVVGRDDSRMPYSASTLTILGLPPNFPIYNGSSFNFLNGYNPEASFLQESKNKTDNLIVNTVMRYTVLKNLTLSVSGGYTRYALDQVTTLPKASLNPAYNPVALAHFNNNSSNAVIVEPQASYSQKVGKGLFSALIGGTWQLNEREGFFLTGSDVSHPDLLGNIGAAGSITSESNTYSKYKYVSVFTRLNYNLGQKYLLNLNFRRDGSTRFGPDQQFGNFGAVGGAWVFTQENVFSKLSALSFGKLRMSYGITGNDQIADYQYLSTYGNSSVYNGVSTLSPSRIANPDYSWESNKKLEAGLDLGFQKNRFLLNISWFRNRSGNQLVPYPLSSQTGFTSYQANLPALIENKGWEFDVTAQLAKNTGFSWNSSFNLTLPQNRLLRYPGLASSSFANIYVIGEDLSVYKGFGFLGIDPQTGLAIMEDINKDGMVRFPEDVKVLGKTSPVIYGGLGNTLGFKGLQLDIFFQFVKQKSVGQKPTMGSLISNMPQFVLNRWQKPGDLTGMIMATTVASNLSLFNSSNAVFYDGSYIRLKNLSLSYSVPLSLPKKTGLTQFQIYLQGQNLLTIDNKKRLDPELSGISTSIPSLTSIVAGIKITL